MATTTQPQTGAKTAASLSNEEILRYSRHLIMPEVGMEGQLKLKNEAARARLANLNPDIQIQSFETQLTSANALELFKDFDVIVDGTDNFPTRYLVNDACILLRKPNVYGSIFRFEGQATVFGMPDG